MQVTQVLPKSVRALWIIAIPFALVSGFALFVYLYGFSVLNPRYFGWMMKADPSVHFFGLNFLLSEPWHWPAGKLVLFNAPDQSSLVFTDSLPIFSLLAKAVGAHPPFQIFGWWILLCFLLQAVGGACLGWLATESLFISLVASLLFLTFPPFLIRNFETTRHYTLLAQFLLFFPLGCLISKNKNHLAWLMVLTLALGVHFYFFAFCALLYFGIRYQKLDEIRLGKTDFVSLGIAAAAIGAVAWLYGYFMIPPANSMREGFGEYSMNLLAWFNSEGHSRSLPAIPLVSGYQREGFHYLGLGVILSFLFALTRKGIRDEWKQYWFATRGTVLRFVIVLLLVLALSIKISISRWVISDYVCGPTYLILAFYFFRREVAWSTVKSFGFALLSFVGFMILGRMLRASGRCMLPLDLLLLVSLLHIRAKPAIVTALLALQLFDVYPLIEAIREENQQLLARANPAIDPAWEQVLQGKNKLILIESNTMEQSLIQYVALTHQLPIGPVYQARFEKKLVREREARQREDLLAGRAEAGALYVIADPALVSDLRERSQLEIRHIDHYDLAFLKPVQ